MDLMFAAEQYAQAQAAAAAAAQYYANAANAAINAATSGGGGDPGGAGGGGGPQTPQGGFGLPSMSLANNPAAAAAAVMLANPAFMQQQQQQQQQQHQQQQQQIQQQLSAAPAPPPPPPPPPPPKSGKSREEEGKEDRDSSSRERDKSRDRHIRRSHDRERSRDKDNRDRSRDRRDRDRDNNRDRDRDRERDKDRDRRDRDRGRDRDRDRERKGGGGGRDRSPRYRSRDRSPSKRERDGSKRERTPESEDEETKNIPPNHTIMLRGLAQHITENDIRQDISDCGLVAKDIRLIRRKETGASRGFAFIEFSNVEDAEAWMGEKQGVLMFKDQYRATMQYSLPREGRPGDPPRVLHDWICGQCGVQNFRRRDQCFKCGGPKTETDGEEGADEVSPHPTTTVLLRGLDALSTEDSVLATLTKITNLPIKSIRIGRDALTNTSRGICYVEMNSVFNAMFLHNQLLAQPPIIDDRIISVSYYRNNGTAATSGAAAAATAIAAAGGVSRSSAANAALAAAQWSHKGETEDENRSEYTDEEVEKMAKYSASMYAKSPKEEASYFEYYKNYYRNGGDATAAAQALKNGAAITNGSSKKKKKEDDLGTVTVNGVDYKRYPIPDVSTYQYDETSGYYYDAISGLYYDANSQYYFNSKTSQYMYWDLEHRTYLPAPTEGDSNASSEDKGKNNKDDKKDKVKTAKRIAKDMERWAKTLNQRKEAAKANSNASLSQPSQQPSQQPLEAQQQQSAPAAATVAASVASAGAAGLEDVAFSALFQNKVNNSSNKSKYDKQVTGLAGLVGYGSEEDSAGPDEEDELLQHTDWSKLACLLCKRQFTSKEKLTKHNQMSDLHKQNLESWRQERGKQQNSSRTPSSSSSLASRSQSQQYRDRAKERREKFGVVDEAPQPNRLKEKYLRALEQVDQSSTVSADPSKNLGSDNIGNKMLQKMGWKEGLGLGKANQGRTSIIEADRRMSQAGLGVTSVRANPNDSYKDCVKRTMYQRYHEMS